MSILTRILVKSTWCRRFVKAQGVLCLDLKNPQKQTKKPFGVTLL